MTTASDLGSVDTNEIGDIYVRDVDSGATTLVSVNATGTDSGNNYSTGASLSPDGTKVAFQSRADDLGPTDSDRAVDDDVYVRDLATGVTTLVSANASGTDSGNAESWDPVFSPDGTKVAFYSRANDLGLSDSDRAVDDAIEDDVYLHDLATGVTTLVSANGAGTDSGNGPTGNRMFAQSEVSSDLVFSPDGTRIAFVSWANDLGPMDSDLPHFDDDADVYVRDLASGTTSLVSVNEAGTDSGDGATGEPTFDPGGTRLVFVSHATNLVAGDSNGELDVFVRDLTTGTTSLVSLNAAGTGSGNRWSWEPAFSPDGTKIAFASAASDLGPTDDSTNVDVYVRDLPTGTTHLVSVNATGSRGGNGTSRQPVFSPDGTKVAFETTAIDLGFTDTNGAADVYVRDLPTGTTHLVSSAATATSSGNGGSAGPLFRPGSSQIAFTSQATNLDPDDDGTGSDIYLASLHGADLSATLDVTPEEASPGGQLSYTVRLANDGPDPADDVVTAVLLPEGTTFDDVETTAGRCRAPSHHERRLVVCDIGNATTGPVATVTVTAKVAASPGSILTALAAVDSATIDPYRHDNVVRAETPVA